MHHHQEEQTVTRQLRSQAVPVTGIEWFTLQWSFSAIVMRSLVFPSKGQQNSHKGGQGEGLVAVCFLTPYSDRVILHVELDPSNVFLVVF